MAPSGNQVELDEDLPNDFSDGDPSTWPNPPYRPSDDNRYRQTLAKLWLEEQGLGQKSINYKFKNLPSGYALFEVPKSDGSDVVYKRLLGHPSRRFYDSTKVFMPHFKWLMGGGQGRCSCKLCGQNTLPGERKEPKPRSRLRNQLDVSNRSTPDTGRTRPRVDDRTFYDEEGTPDVYRTLLQKLSSGKRINEKIKEPQSMDWRAEREILPSLLSRISLQHQFLPRVGELVLWTVDLDHEIAFNQEHRQFQKYDFDKDKWLGCPEWMAGTVTQVAKDSGDFQDLVEDVDQDDAVNVSGYRVETLPDPNNDINKSLSKHYKYIPLRQIRPLSYWQQYLRGTDEKDIHPSVKHALTVASSISLVEKFRFRGKEKEAEIFCKGIYLGPELYIVGDAIRIMPEDDHQNCSDILVITSIRLRLHQISRETAFESRKLADQTSIRIYGHAYTTTATRSYAKDVPDGRPLNATELATLFPLVGMASLGNWYRLHDSNSRYEISFDRILGRLYEPAATCIWLNSPVASTSPKTILSFDIPAVRSARTYSRQTDARIANDRSWFWADTRAQTLALETFNGREVGPYDDEVRNQEALRKWRAHLRVLDNNYTEEDLLVTAPLESGSGKKRGRKPGSKLVNGKIVHPGQPGFDGTAGTRVASSRMVEAAFESSAEEEDSDGQDASGMKGLTLNVRRSVEKGPASKSNTDDDVPMKDVISSEEEPLPPHVERGGTDETDGGDYMPGFEDFQKRPEKKPKI